MNAPISIATPLQMVQERYNLLHNPRLFQVEVIDDLAPKDRSGLYLEPGLGKTLCSIICALFKRLQGEAQMTVVIMPPILITNWAKALSGFSHKDGTPLKTLAYRGSPKERAAMKFAGHDFILMSMQIFKKDYAKVVSETLPYRVHVILDEATSIKNVSSDNHKKFRDFCAAYTVQLLTGTPLNTPADGYAYIKLISPGVYRTLYQFEALHIVERDFFKKPVKWGNLDLLQQNLLLNSQRRIKEDVLSELPKANIIPVYYDLEPKHYKLYKQLAEEQLLRFDDGTKMDMTSVSALFHALGQVICNMAHFTQNESDEAQAFQLIDEALEEIGDKKLVVFTNYRMTSRRVVDRYAASHGAIGIWGDITNPKVRDANLAKFIEDPDCRLIVLQQVAGGLGIDGLQRVCSDCVFIECPGNPLVFEQAMSRLYRDGQEFSVNVRIAVANDTLQCRTLKQVSNKQHLVNSVQGGLSSLRDAVFGN